MRISIIVATDLDRVIGKDGGLPWRLPADLKRFRRLTLDKPIIMGRRTFESIGKPLDRRTNIVLTRDPEFHAEGCHVTRDASEALRLAGKAEEVMIIGGAGVYELFLLRCDRIYLTRVQDRFDGDTSFPRIDLRQWKEVEESDHPADDENPHAHRFSILERIRSEKVSE